MTIRTSCELASTARAKNAALTEETYRAGMARLAGAVNIVTTDGPAGKAGFTATAVCSVCAEPPTLLVCVNANSTAGPVFSANNTIAVNTLTPMQERLARIFGGQLPMSQRFEDGEWCAGESGAPLLKDSLVSFDCEVTRSVGMGTHAVLFARVRSVIIGRDSKASVYYARRFHEIGEPA
ncbi:flavin reductase [Amaricoccus macauensis]|uniref:flavin reductase n=1 Tax=Amaricoccus macauensis TaxID=57001 RepID=UPI003C7EBDE8